MLWFGSRVDEVERPVREPEGDHRAEHQERPGHRVDDELQRRRLAARPAPHADQDVERDQHRLPEHVEEQEVLGGEDAEIAPVRKSISPKYARGRSRPTQKAYAMAAAMTTTAMPAEPERER